MTLTCAQKFQKPCRCPLPRQSVHSSEHTLVNPPFLVCSEDPAWKRLISLTPTMPERISLITKILADSDEVEAVEMLSGDDAQNFINVIDEVGTCIFLTSEGCINLAPT
jgi:hypothetical protein